MLVLIEGADKQGKTTLARALAKELNWEYRHHGPPVDGAIGYLQELQGLRYPVVMDRSFIGERVYGPLLRNRACYDYHQEEVLYRYAQRLNAVVIHCQQKEANDWFKLDTQLGIDYQMNLRAQYWFNHVMVEARRFLEVWMYEEYNLKGLRWWVNQQIPKLKERLIQSSIVSDNISGIGSILPELIIVGERVNSNATWAHLPFDRGTCSEYLFKSIKLARLPRDIYLMNAYHDDGTPRDYRELCGFVTGTMPVVIALGNKASTWLHAANVKHSKIPHPAYHRRFRAGHILEYVHWLEEIYHERLAESSGH